MKTATRIARPTAGTSTDQTASMITEPETEPTDRPLSPWAAAMDMVVGAFWAIGEILGN